MAGHELKEWKKELAALRAREQGRVPDAKDQRWAQRQCQGNTDEWQRFVASKGARDARLKIVGEKPPESLAPPSSEEIDPSLPEPVYMERVHWAMWKAAYLSWRTATEEIDEIQYAAMTVKLRESYEKARRDREAWEIAHRRLIDISETREAQTAWLQTRNLIDNLPQEFSIMLRESGLPDDLLEVVRRKLSEWVTGPYQQAFTDVIAKFQQLAA